MIFDILLLVTAICMDEFVASMAYGADGITIRPREMILMNLVSSVFLGLAFLFGQFLNTFIPENATKFLCIFCLFGVGFVKLLEGTLKGYINRQTERWKNVSFHFSGLKFIISVYGNPVNADEDGSKSLSVKETLFLACAMSLDSLFVGALAAFLTVSIPLTIALTFGIGMLAVFMGDLLGKKVLSNSKYDFSWMSGALLMLLALSKIFLW